MKNFFRTIKRAFTRQRRAEAYRQIQAQMPDIVWNSEIERLIGSR